MRIAVLGVGRMGLPIVRHLVTGGHEVVAVDPDAERRAAAVAAGATVADSGAQAATSVEVLMTVLPGPIECERALTAEGVLDALPTGALWIDLTSNDPRVVERLGDAAAARGVEAVTAALAGGVAAAESATLGFFVGGPEAAVGRALPLLGLLGASERVELVGSRPADASAAKLLSNLVWFGQVVAVTEALQLGQSLGLEPEPLRAVLARGAAGSRFLDEEAGSLLDGDYLTTFGIDRVVEELETLSALAREAGLPFELSDLVTRLHREAFERFGPADGELLAAKLLELRAGRELRR
jgi:3-hydroxyisobutyrate dehydrogenase-like beta-hydroxyacid dehydrogenase